MGTTFQCPSCGHPFVLEDTTGIQKTRCPHCKVLVALPNSIQRTDLQTVAIVRPRRFRRLAVSGICLAVILLAGACTWLYFKTKHQRLQDRVRAEVQSMIAEAEVLARNPATALAAYAKYEAAYAESAQLDDGDIAKNIPGEMTKMLAVAEQRQKDERVTAEKAEERRRAAAANEARRRSAEEEQKRVQTEAARKQKEEEDRQRAEQNAQDEARKLEEQQKLQAAAAKQRQPWINKLNLARACIVDGRRGEAIEHLRAIADSGDAVVLRDALKVALSLRYRELVGTLATSAAKVAPDDSFFRRTLDGYQKLVELGKTAASVGADAARVQDSIQADKAEIARLTAAIQNRHYTETTTTRNTCPTCGGSGMVPNPGISIPANRICPQCGGKKYIVNSTTVTKERDVSQFIADRDRRQSSLPAKEKQLREVQDRAVHLKNDTDQVWSDVLTNVPQ